MISSAICRDEAGKVHFVDGDGSLDAPVVFIGEAPGKTEDLMGKPFVGRSGKLLTELIEMIGFERSDIYITNIVKCRPPENRDPSPEEVTAGLAYLMRELALIKPKLIVFLGRHALNAFFPGKIISKVHGQPFRMKGQIYLPVYHPAAALYRPENKKDLIRDFKKIPILLNKLNVVATSAAN